ncbi:MAG: N-acetylglucosamine-6-phosphate deacetylase [Pyrinomonadaceae bacterium]
MRLTIENGMIVDVGNGPLREIASNGVLTQVPEGGAVVPGFVDVHCHGAVGIDVNSADAEDLRRVSAYLARNGVTGWMPTLVPDTAENYGRTIAAIDEAMSKPVSGARILGVHYEGVFASPDMCGALRSEYFKEYDAPERLDELPLPENGSYMMTLAPEVYGGLDLIRELSKRGWVISIGHTAANAGNLDEALKAGASHATHFFNAMTGIHHRRKGVAGWVLTNDDVSIDIIADGKHIAPEMLSFAVRAKGVSKTSLISDSVAPTGLGDGCFRLWGREITVENGITREADGGIAGSVITMLDARGTMARLGFSEEELAELTATNPCRLLGLSDRGEIEPGQLADLVVIDPEGSVSEVFIEGRKLELN